MTTSGRTGAAARGCPQEGSFQVRSSSQAQERTGAEAKGNRTLLVKLNETRKMVRRITKERMPKRIRKKASSGSFYEERGKMAPSEVIKAADKHKTKGGKHAVTVLPNQTPFSSLHFHFHSPALFSLISRPSTCSFFAWNTLSRSL